MFEDYIWPSMDAPLAAAAEAPGTPVAQAPPAETEDVAQAEAQRRLMAAARLQRARQHGQRYLSEIRARAARERAAILAELESDVVACVHQAVAQLVGREPASSIEDTRRLVERILAEAGRDGMQVWTHPDAAEALGTMADKTLSLGEARARRADGATWRSDVVTRQETVRAALEEIGIADSN